MIQTIGTVHAYVILLSMKIIKLFITSMLLLSSFQTFAGKPEALRITTAADFSTPDGK
jgi:hypothetical protein